jgi:hypothetical protein
MARVRVQGARRRERKMVENFVTDEGSGRWGKGRGHLSTKFRSRLVAWKL